MNWELFNIIGTIAFAGSGAVVAMEADYDVLGVVTLGLVTAFGGGIIRNILIGLPMSVLWEQGFLFQVALITIAIVFLLPHRFIQKIVQSTFLDAIGLSAFSIQGALHAMHLHLPLSAVIVASVMTGIGGGMVRDLLAGRKPLVLREEIYATWSIIIGVCIGLGFTHEPLDYVLLFVAIVILRMLAVFYQWKLPRRSFIGVERSSK